MTNSLKEKISKWINQIGRESAGLALLLSGIHIDTAYRILNGTYKSDPKKELMDKIERALTAK